MSNGYGPESLYGNRCRLKNSQIMSLAEMSFVDFAQ